jgi:glutaredoxin
MWLLILLAIIDIYILSQTKKGGTPAAVSDGKTWTVYGTMGCGWTRKQLDYMKEAGKPFKFVDCDKGGCSDLEAFPTLVSPDGKQHIGYNEV